MTTVLLRQRDRPIRETVSSHYIPFYTTRLHCCYYLCIPLWGFVDRHPVSGEVGRQVIRLVLDFNSVSFAFSINSYDRFLSYDVPIDLADIDTLMVRSGTRVPLYESFYSNTTVSSNENMQSQDPREWPYCISLQFAERVIMNWFVFVNPILQEIRLSNNTSDYEDPVRPSATLLRCTIMKFDSVLILLWLPEIRVSVSVIGESYG